MLQNLREYGLHREVLWSDRQIALGGNFSATLPEDRFDAQPLWNQDRTICLVADVRLDNRSDLARHLDLSHPEEIPDSAFLIAAWLRWGEACLDHIFGAFAFAIWIPHQQQLFAACDHAGERSLFYHRSDGLFALASMPKGLFAIPGIPRTLREPHIVNWLAGLENDHAAAFFAAVQRIPVGHFLRVTAQTLECKRYWHPAEAKPVRYKKDEEYAEALLEIFDRATEARLRSVKPVGSFLSAGLDSSSVTASAARLLAAQGKRLTAFTSVPRPGYDGVVPPGFFNFEAEGAAELARLYPNIDHAVVDSRHHNLLDTMKLWTGALDEPTVNVVNLLWISAILGQAKERGIGVMLEGTAGNAAFSYSSWHVLNRFFRRGRWFKLAQTAYQYHRRGALGLSSAARFAAGGLVPRWLTRRRLSAQTLSDLFTPLANPQWAKQYDLEERIVQAFYPRPRTLVEEHCEVFDWMDSGPHLAAMQSLFQIEVRDPTADKRIWDFCFAIPPEQFAVAGWSRSLARRSMKDRLPQSILTNCKRGLQDGDWYLAMSESLPGLRREMALLAQSPSASHALNLPAMQALLDTWPEAGFHTSSVYDRWNAALTHAFSMGYFLRTHEPSSLT